MFKSNFKKLKDMPYSLKVISGLLLSSLVGLFIMLISSIIISFVLKESESLPESLIVYFLICEYISCFMCGFISNKVLPFKGIISGFVSGLILILYIFIIVAVISIWQLNILSFLIPTGIIVSVSGGIASANLKKRK